MDPHINPVTGVWDDNYYAQTQGGGGGGTADSYLQQAINSITSMIKPLKPYDEVNPFSFDEQLARQASTAEYSPYYQELLTDYTSGVERNLSRSQQDLTKTLEQLSQGKEYYMGTERRLLDKAIKNTNEGYAGRGLFFSGANEKEKRDIQTQYGADIGNYENQYNYNTGQAKTETSRYGEDLATAKSQYERNNQREKQLAIEQGVLTRKGEALDEYNAGRTKYYSQQFG